VVKTEMAAQQQAQQVGFSYIVTKPIEVPELESKIAKAMNLDTSQRYFTLDGDIFIMRLPENTSQTVVGEVLNYLKPKISEAVDTGIVKAVIDLHELKGLNMAVIKLLITAMQTCKDLALQYTLVGNTQIVSECKGFEDTRNWQFHESLADAKASFGNKTSQAQPAVA